MDEKDAKIDELGRQLMRVTSAALGEREANQKRIAELEDAAGDALADMSDWDTAWTPAGVETRQRLRAVLGHEVLPVCPECKVDMGGHGHGCSLNHSGQVTARNA